MAYFSDIHKRYCGKGEMCITAIGELLTHMFKPFTKTLLATFTLCKECVNIYLSTFYVEKKLFLSPFFYDRLNALIE